MLLRFILLLSLLAHHSVTDYSSDLLLVVGMVTWWVRHLLPGDGPSNNRTDWLSHTAKLHMLRCCMLTLREAATCHRGSHSAHRAQHSATH